MKKQVPIHFWEAEKFSRECSIKEYKLLYQTLRNVATNNLESSDI
jgi:hypothetical protein